MNLVPVSKPVIGRVVTNRLCMKGKSASFVRHVEVDVSDTPLAGSFLAGQSFGVIPPGVDEHGKPHKVRLFSVASPSFGEDGAGKVVATTVKRLIDEYRPESADRSDKRDPDNHALYLGICSNYICDLREGDEVAVTGPNGKRFLLPATPEQHDYLFLATGTGIAPFRGMVYELLEGPNGPVDSRIDLVMGCPYETDLLYDEWFRALDDAHPNFHYHTAISRERRPAGASGGYVHHLLADRLDAFRDLICSPRTLMYMCGLEGMQVGLYRVLGEAGLCDGYLTVHEDLADVEPASWNPEQIKRRIRPTRRCMVEVY